VAYCTTCDVYALTPGLVKPASAYDTATCPTLAQVTTWVTAGSSAIDTQLASAGYGPIPTSSAAYGLAGQANALFGAWFAERSRINARISADERTRADMFRRDYESMMEYLIGMDLSMAGVPVLVAGRPYAGGIDVADKDAVTADTSRVKPRFTRNMGHNSERGT
jgi:hypothetical protein